VDYPALRLEVAFLPTHGAIRNANFEISADGYIEARAEGHTAAAQVLAVGIFLEGESAGIFAPHS
jgi:hypothetical protein